MEELGAGEFLVNSIDNDGMMQGYDTSLLKLVSEHTDRPVIALGGAGHFEHLAEVLERGFANAVACASLFHFGDNNPIRARSFLKNRGLPVKNT
jgi:cyclase